jgi:hypothetical protein
VCAFNDSSSHIGGNKSKSKVRFKTWIENLEMGNNKEKRRKYYIKKINI